MCALCKYLSRAQEGKEKKTQARKQISIIRYELYGSFLFFSREKHEAKRGNLKLRDWIKFWGFLTLLGGCVDRTTLPKVATRFDVTGQSFRGIFAPN